jgi:hypothetical protein
MSLRAEYRPWRRGVTEYRDRAEAPGNPGPKPAEAGWSPLAPSLRASAEQAWRGERAWGRRFVGRNGGLVGARWERASLTPGPSPKGRGEECGAGKGRGERGVERARLRERFGGENHGRGALGNALPSPPAPLPRGEGRKSFERARLLEALRRSRHEERGGINEVGSPLRSRHGARGGIGTFVSHGTTRQGRRRWCRGSRGGRFA